MTLLFLLLVDPLRKESGKSLGLVGMQVMAAIQLQVVDFAMLTRHQASQLMEFVIPLAADIRDRQPALRQPGSEIRLLAKGGGAQHGGHGLAVVAKAASDLAGAGRLIEIGKYPLPIPIFQHISQGLALETLCPALIVGDAGCPLIGWQPRVAVLQQQSR